MEKKEIVSVCKALSDENRLRMIELLSSEEKCGCKLLEAFDITQPTLSHHMRVLTECGLVHDRKEGKWHYYSLNKERFKEFIQLIRLLGEVDW